jgi:hypothetical protein
MVTIRRSPARCVAAFAFLARPLGADDVKREWRSWSAAVARLDGWPQFMQNLAPVCNSAWQFEQRLVSGPPQLEQKRAPSRLSALHRGQCI